MDAGVTERNSVVLATRLHCGSNSEMHLLVGDIDFYELFYSLELDPSASGHLILGCNFIIFPSFSLLSSPPAGQEETGYPWRQDVWKMYETTASDLGFRYR